MRVNLKLPNISEDEKTPIVVQLLALIEQQASITEQQADMLKSKLFKYANPMITIYHNIAFINNNWML